MAVFGAVKKVPNGITLMVEFAEPTHNKVRNRGAGKATLE
jgi:hypothetical protein